MITFGLKNALGANTRYIFAAISVRQVAAKTYRHPLYAILGRQRKGNEIVKHKNKILTLKM